MVWYGDIAYKLYNICNLKLTQRKKLVSPSCKLKVSAQHCTLIILETYLPTTKKLIMTTNCNK